MTEPSPDTESIAALAAKVTQNRDLADFLDERADIAKRERKTLRGRILMLMIAAVFLLAFGLVQYQRAGILKDRVAELETQVERIESQTQDPHPYPHPYPHPSPRTPPQPSGLLPLA